MNNQFPKLSSQYDKLQNLITSLAKITEQLSLEKILVETFANAVEVEATSTDYYAVLNHQLYRYILKRYKHQENHICLWRFFKNVSPDQLNYQNIPDAELQMMDSLVRVYFYSDPLDDLTCIFVPINDNQPTKQYLNWIRSYFYDVNYPTSLLWLYALDSSLSSLFPDEIMFFGKGIYDEYEHLMIPDFDYLDTVLIKRFSSESQHYVKLEGVHANNEFRQIFTFLQQEFKDRCLSRSGKKNEAYHEEWEKFEDVLKFGVSDRNENGCISFSDMRSSTEFLNEYGKSVYLTKVQQPFFEKTKLISKQYHGRIDKFMGDNVMCVFLNNNMQTRPPEDKEKAAILNNFLALIDLCKVLLEIILANGFEKSKLGLRSGITYGNQLLRSNLGNELVRDFTVTGETVNLASRLEHISFHELIIHNRLYFEKAITRFPQIHELITVVGNYGNLNAETRTIVQDFTLYQNMVSNLEKLETVKFDIRCNQELYNKLQTYLAERGYEVLNRDTAAIYGYEEYEIEQFKLKFYFSYYNPKGFSSYEKIWILPLETEVLQKLDISKLR